MTIDKRENIVLPQWILNLLVTFITALVLFYGIFSGIREKTLTSEKNIEILRQEKVGREEFNLILDKLNTIENKLDRHTENERNPVR